LFTNATLYIIVNGAPYFLTNPFTEPDATAGQFYSGMISTNAADPNGDVLAFAKIHGPAWLGVAGDGTLSGTALSADAGTNSFMVSTTDPGGLSATATMNINVAPSPVIIASVSLQAGTLSLSWAGGAPPYQVQMATNLTSPAWQTIAGPISTNALTLSPSNDAAFYRIVGQ
jgi:hypothetical protein